MARSTDRLIDSLTRELDGLTPAQQRIRDRIDTTLAVLGWALILGLYAAMVYAAVWGELP